MLILISPAVIAAVSTFQIDVMTPPIPPRVPPPVIVMAPPPDEHCSCGAKLNMLGICPRYPWHMQGRS